MTDTTEPAVRSLAEEARDCFETAKRDSGETFERIQDGSPEWVSDLTREAHGGMFPDDWRYECIRAALGAIVDAGDDADLDETGHEFADSFVDVYTNRLTGWLSSNVHRPGYCDEAAEEYGGEPDGIVSRIQLGQYAEAREVYGIVLGELRERAEEQDDEDEDA